MGDEYNAGNKLSDPARKVFLITPSDSERLPVAVKAIRADAAGAITFRTVGSNADVTMNFAAGEERAYRVEYIRDTGTDAIAIHGIA